MSEILIELVRFGFGRVGKVVGLFLHSDSGILVWILQNG
jgi:hypothetical protein